MLGREGEHLRLHGVVRDQRQRLRFERVQAVGAGVRRQARVHALHLDPVARRATVEMKGLPWITHWRLSAIASGKIEDGSTGSMR